MWCSMNFIEEMEFLYGLILNLLLEFMVGLVLMSEAD